MTLKEKFELDKNSLLIQTKEFLENHKQPYTPDLKHEIERSAITEAVKSGNFTKALQTLEKLRDKKTGITLYEVEQKDPNITPIIIRDARGAYQPPSRYTESFEMQYLNAIRAAIDIAKIEQKPELEQDLKNMAVNFIENFHIDNNDLSQKEMFSHCKDQILGITDFLEKNGIKDAVKKVNVAKDFQNLNDKHANIVTISTLKNGEDSHIVIEAEVALKGLIQEQKSQYQSINDGGQSQPKWYSSMPYWLQKLTSQYAEVIIEGNHVKSTQLRQLPGMSNAFEKLTIMVDAKSNELNILHAAKHAGTLASFSNSKDSQQEITNENTRQAMEWIGNERRLHCLTFNSGPKLGTETDRHVLQQTLKAVEEVGAKITNAAFNYLRFSSYANIYSGVRDVIEEISGALPDASPIKAHLDFKQLSKTSLEDAERKIKQLLDEDEISPQVASILTDTARLAVLVKDSDVAFRLDLNNSNADISVLQNQITRKIAALDNKTGKGLDLNKLQKEEILNMCASGKDRTGLAMHDQSAHAIAEALDVKVGKVDARLLDAGHTAQQAGGIYSGGASVGSFGTKTDNEQNLPLGRRKVLKTIIETSAEGNVIKPRTLSSELLKKALELTKPLTRVRPKQSAEKKDNRNTRIRDKNSSRIQL